MLSVFHCVYLIILAERGRQVVLWPSVVEELRVFRALMPFLSSCWWLRWNLLLSSSDASANGQGVSTSMWTHGEVYQAGRTRERDRFRDCRAVFERVHAMGDAGLVENSSSPEEDEDLAIDTAKVIAHRDTEKLRQLRVDHDFPEVATSTCPIAVGASILGAWRHDQNIHVLEAVSGGITSSFSTQFARPGRLAKSHRLQSRCMHLLRSVSEQKFRIAQSDTGVRQLFPCNNFFKPTVRCVPSEFDCSDELSRRSEPFPSVSHLLTHEFDRAGESEKRCGVRDRDTDENDVGNTAG